MPLGKRADFGDARYAGAEVEFTCDIIDTLQVCAALLAISEARFLHCDQRDPPTFPKIILGSLDVTQLRAPSKLQAGCIGVLSQFYAAASPLEWL